MGVYTFDIVNTLWTFYMEKNFALWKIFGNWMCICHCTVVFPVTRVIATSYPVPKMGNAANHYSCASKQGPHSPSMTQDHVRYDLHKFHFANRVSTLWNCLPDIVVKAESVNSFSLREDWTDSGMITWKLNLIVKLTLKVPEVEVIQYKFYFKTLNFLHAISHYTGH